LNNVQPEKCNTKYWHSILIRSFVDLVKLDRPFNGLRISLKCKYELEESTSQSPQLAENDANNPSGQSTITMSGGGDQAYEPPIEPKTKTERQLKQELETVKQELEQKAERIAFLEETQPVTDIPQLVDDKVDL
jgi:hypothetical protein